MYTSLHACQQQGSKISDLYWGPITVLYKSQTVFNAIRHKTRSIKMCDKRHNYCHKHSHRLEPCAAAHGYTGYVPSWLCSGWETSWWGTSLSCRARGRHSRWDAVDAVLGHAGGSPRGSRPSIQPTVAALQTYMYVKTPRKQQNAVE